MPDTAGEPRRTSPLLFVLYFVAYLSVLVRMLFNENDTGVVQPLAWGLMAGFLALSIARPPLARRWPPVTHLALDRRAGADPTD